MRVVGVVHQFPPDFETGTEILCLRTMQALAQRGHQVQVISAEHRRGRGSPVRRAIVDGVEVVRIPTRGKPRLSIAARLGDEFTRDALVQRLIDIGRQFRPEIVHAFHVFHFGIPAITAISQLAPLLVTATDFALVCPYATCALPDGTMCGGPALRGDNCVDHHLTRPAHNGLARRQGPMALLEQSAAVASRLANLDSTEDIRSAVLARLAAGRDLAHAAHRVLATSGRIASMLAAIGIPGEKITVTPHQAPPLAVPSRAPGEPMRIGFLGVLTRLKGAHVLIDAARRIPAGRTFELIVRGDQTADPTYVAELNKMAAEDRRIRIVDKVPHARFAEALGDIDVLVVPSTWAENSPLVLLSALAAGRFVVVSDVPGLVEAVDDPHSGRIFPVGDSEALAKVLVDILTDPAPVRRARARSQGFDKFAGYIDTLEKLYRDATARNRTAGRLSAGVIA